jgi:hypothetical protein
MNEADFIIIIVVEKMHFWLKKIDEYVYCNVLSTFEKKSLSLAKFVFFDISN